MLTGATIRLIRESGALLPAGAAAPVQEFYRRLFELAPEVRPLFKRDITLQSKKLSEMLAWVIDHLEQPEALLPALRRLGARHGTYGVQIDYYAPVGSALIWMFQHTLGDRFTPQMEEAWLEAFAFISSEMERGCREELPLEQPKEP
jgi:nitric oxide dioxygenase